jgi:hypothetical protein
MIRSIPVFILLIFMSVSELLAATGWNPNRKKNFEDLRKPIVLKLSPFHFFDRQLSLTGDFFNKNYRRSMAVTLSLIYADNSRIYDVGTTFQLERRFYPRGFMADTSNTLRNSASGFYFGLGFQGGYSEYHDLERYRISIIDPITNIVTFKDDDVQIQSMWIAPIVSLGYQIILWDALYLDAFVGGGIKFNQTEKISSRVNVDLSQYYQDPDIFSRYYKGIIPRVGVTLGIGL